MRDDIERKKSIRIVVNTLTSQLEPILAVISQMNFANPYLFDAILDGIPHRFVLVQECEFLQGNDGFSPPRFSVGAVNATRDPRYSAIRQLMEVGVSDSALQIPPCKQNKASCCSIVYKAFLITTITLFSLADGPSIHLHLT